MNQPAEGAGWTVITPLGNDLNMDTLPYAGEGLEGGEGLRR